MRASSILLGVLVLVLAISTVSIWFFPSVQDFMAANTMWNGIRDFMSTFKATNIESLSNLPSSPEKSAIVEIPYLPHSEKELPILKQFVEDGGTLILMDDFGFGNNVLEYLGLEARFSTKPLVDPLFNYRNQVFPRITDFSPDVKNSGVNVIVFDHGTALTDVASSNVIAWSSAASFLDTEGKGNWSQGEPKGPLPVAASFRLGQGTVDIVSDPSIIISSMMGRDDNYRFVAYLVGGRQVLFDSSSLPKAPLDQSKTALLSFRQLLADPYILVIITAATTVIVSAHTLRRRETVA